jgi:SAM-dependent methyltransferase
MSDPELGRQLPTEVSDSPHLFWGMSAEAYERHAAVSAYNALYDRPAVLDVLGPVAQKRVLDLGCGPGLYAEEMVRRGGSVVGVDQNPDMVALAARRVPEGAEFRVHDLAEPLSWLKEETFDLALMALVLHHLDDRVRTLREVRRVLKPSGALVVSTHHPTRDWLAKGGSYFAIELVEESEPRGWQVRFWRQPLTATCRQFVEAGFLIDALVEPLPSAPMAEQYPENFKTLSQEPGFIIFRLTPKI